ncbi:hypothetical protein S83_070069 [Arachis hypogaea]
MADAYSANMFLVSWAQLSQPTKPTILTHQPCFRSSRLSPQRPPSINPSIDRVYHVCSPYGSPPFIQARAKYQARCRPSHLSFILHHR